MSASQCLDPVKGLLYDPDGIVQQTVDKLVSFVSFRLVSVAVETGFYGVFTALSILSIYLVMSNGLKTTGHWLLVLVTTAMFGLVSSHLVLNSITTISSLEDRVTSGINDAVYSVSCHGVVIQTGHKKATSHMEVVQFLLPIFNFALSDLVVIWRVWAIWKPSIIIPALPGTLLLGSLVSAIATIFSDSKLYYVPGNEAGQHSQYVALAMIFATNILSTLLIAIKTWSHRLTMKAFFASHGKSSRTKVEAVLALLTESGVIYCIIWVVYVCAMNQVYSVQGPSLWVNVMGACMVHITAIYPTTIVILIALQKTAWDMGMSHGSINVST